MTGLKNELEKGKAGEEEGSIDSDGINCVMPLKMAPSSFFDLTEKKMCL